MPTVLQTATLRQDAQATLEGAYTVHKMVGTDAFPTIDPASIDAIVTGGHNGASASLIQRLPNLKIIAINGVGYDKVDLELARERGIRVTNTPDVLTDDVADLAIGLTLTILRRLHHAHHFVTAGHWGRGEIALARKMSGKHFGLLGMGRIGRAIAKRLTGFDAVISYTDVAKQNVPYSFVPDLLTLAGDSDVLIVAAAASASTRNIVSEAVLDALGPNGCLVNIARGSIVDEPALVEALKTGRLGAAALDVFADEPNVPADLLGMENVVLTPHIASATHETRAAMAKLMLDNLEAYFAGRPLLTPVA